MPHCWWIPAPLAVLSPIAANPGPAEQFHRQWWISSGGLDANGGSVQLQSVQLGTNEQLDSLSYHTITVGFLMLTVGRGGAGGEQPGAFWGWDPKETWALILEVYAAYLHTASVAVGRADALL